MPRVLPYSSAPWNRLRSQRPSRRARWAWGMLRAWARIRATVLGGRDHRVRLGGVDDHDPEPGGGGRVDVVQADAIPADDLEVAAGLQHLGVDPGGRPDHQGVDAPDRAQQLSRVMAARASTS